MPNYTGLENRDILVTGLAESGYEAAELLSELGTNITVNDRKDLSQDAHAKDSESMGTSVVSGSHPLTLLGNNPITIKNPGIPYTIPVIDEVVKRDLKISTEVELSYPVSKTPIIAATGTNGRATITSLIRDMLKKSHLTGKSSGNIGYIASKVT